MQDGTITNKPIIGLPLKPILIQRSSGLFQYSIQVPVLRLSLQFIAQAPTAAMV